LPQSLGRRLALGIGLGAILYLVLAIYAGWHDLQATMRLFRWSWLPFVLCLSLANYIVRFGRWHLYLHRSGVPIGAGLSLRIFFCGLVMSVTPGKFGEVLKAYLVKLHTGVPVSRTGPVVVAERVTDLLALVVLLFIGALVYRTGWLELVISGAVTLILLVGLASPHAAAAVLHLLERIGPARAHVQRVERAYESMRFLMRPTLLVQATMLGAVAWFAECLGFTLVLHGLGVAEPVARTTFIYALSTLVGALLLLPGGLGGTEASMVAMLGADGAAPPMAVAATFLTRVATLWFAVLLGALVLLGNRRLMAGTASTT
jgi:glycosyltransferase 2 family protein